MSSSDLFRVLPDVCVSIERPTGPLEHTEAAVRFYSWQRGSAWNLQIRGRRRLARGGAGEFMYANATLGLEDLVELRDELERAIVEAREWATSLECREHEEPTPGCCGGPE